ncbi:MULTISPECIES: MgtC/SapB family protein [Halocynthiibacter]|uniref:Protein MgtC n=1 Tax=Halocynthiibacter halioticoli TaxID=2986804 RepID=A0AAE3IZB8_9RHOB|nr:MULTISPECIES: MgtC/SapB family protein [Halocynthiibacter]MCV6824853.1 MgtC/SapB family protein [Halocynthiibacter halioticoli]MCW4057854.1 MgtC/SapB family protein [Halocynthiibacter sp. SDUM655004]
MLDFETFLFRCCVALGLGLLVGLDREFKHKPLGLRSYLLVSLGSAALCMISLNIAENAATDNYAFDLSRVVAGVVGGIGFLGAGAIMSNRSDGKLRGVGSGSLIWVVGIIGIAVGFGYVKEATSVTVLAFLVLTIVGWLRDRFELQDTDEKS